MGKILGIDFGTKRIGLAISDESQTFAFPLSVLENNPGFIGEVEKIIKKESIKTVILGESKNFKGEDNAIMPATRIFKENLENIGTEVLFHPEFLTSFQAEQIQGKTDMLDASAAALILQSFLDTNKNLKDNV